MLTYQTRRYVLSWFHSEALRYSLTEVMLSKQPKCHFSLLKPKIKFENLSDKSLISLFVSLYYLFLRVEWAHCCPLWLFGVKTSRITGSHQL